MSQKQIGVSGAMIQSILNSKADVLMNGLLLVKSMGKSNLFISASAWLRNELTYIMPLDITIEICV